MAKGKKGTSKTKGMKAMGSKAKGGKKTLTVGKKNNNFAWGE